MDVRGVGLDIVSRVHTGDEGEPATSGCTQCHFTFTRALQRVLR